MTTTGTRAASPRRRRTGAGGRSPAPALRRIRVLRGRAAGRTCSVASSWRPGSSGLAGAGLLVVSRLADVAKHGFVAANQVHPSVLTHALAVLVAFGLHGWLKRRPLSGAALVTADTLITEALVAVCLAHLRLLVRDGHPPGRAPPRTAADRPRHRAAEPAAPDPAGSPFPRHSASWRSSSPTGGPTPWTAHPFPQGGFAAYVLWDQATLWLAVGLAGLTSRVVYAARVQAHEVAKIGRYTLEARIGGGAIGEVYRARQALMRRPVALKILRPEVASGRNLELFEQEVQRTSELTHPEHGAGIRLRPDAGGPLLLRDGVPRRCRPRARGGGRRRHARPAGPARPPSGVRIAGGSARRGPDPLRPEAGESLPLPSEAGIRTS